MLRLPAVLVLLASLIAVPVAGAKKLPKTATFKVEYDGNGTWSRDSGFTAPCTTAKSKESATFDWDVTWAKVKVYLHKTKAADLSKPKGKFTISKDHDTSGTDTCGGEPPADCSVSDSKSFGSMKEFAELRIGLQGKSNDLLMLPDADTSVLGDSDNCPIYGDGSAHPTLYMANYGIDRDDALPSPLEAHDARIPIKEAVSHGKHIVFVKNGPTNLPGQGLNCAPADGYTTCTESQSWSGHITLTRVK
jgi:hypothetical protein